MSGKLQERKIWEDLAGRDVLAGLSRPVKIAVPVLAVCALIAAVLTSGDGDTTSLETEALHSSTLPIEEDPTAGGVPSLDQEMVDSLRSPSTLRSNGDRGTIDVSTPSTATSAPSLTSATADATTTSTATTSSTTTTTAPPATTATTTTTQPPTTTTQASSTTTQPPTTQPPTTQPPTTEPPTTGGGACRGSNEFERVFRDDFNGDQVSDSWRQYYSIGNAGYGLRRPAAISVQNGRLVITAEMVDGDLVSGGMAHKYDQTYGKYVFKVRVDEDPDLATSAVVLTWPESEVHPRDGENNIYESLTYDADRDPFYSVIHKPYGERTDHIVHNHNADGTQFQTMTMEWRPDGITIIREGPGFAGDYERWVQPETPEDWIPDVPHHITIQLDAWKQAMSTSVRMEVDFVEVYRYCG